MRQRGNWGSDCRVVPLTRFCMGRIVGEKNNGYVHGVRDIVASFIVYGAKEYIPRHLKRGSSKPTARKSGLSLISLDLGEKFASLSF